MVNTRLMGRDEMRFDVVLRDERTDGYGLCIQLFLGQNFPR